jgi:hypothetical protein
MDSTIRQLSGSANAVIGKTRRVEKNINHFLTGRWF